jgi:hypothetical protein
MCYRFPVTFPASILAGMVMYYVIGLLMRIIGRLSGEHGPELSFILLYIVLVGGGAALLMGGAAALMTLLAGGERWAWFSLWPFLIYGGMILAFSIDIQDFARELTIVGTLILIPGLIGSAIPAFRYWRQNRAEASEGRTLE